MNCFSVCLRMIFFAVFLVCITPVHSQESLEARIKNLTNEITQAKRSEMIDLAERLQEELDLLKELEKAIEEEDFERAAELKTKADMIAADIDRVYTPQTEAFTSVVEEEQVEKLSAFYGELIAGTVWLRSTDFLSPEFDDIWSAGLGARVGYKHYYDVTRFFKPGIQVNLVTAHFYPVIRSGGSFVAYTIAPLNFGFTGYFTISDQTFEVNISAGLNFVKIDPEVPLQPGIFGNPTVLYHLDNFIIGVNLASTTSVWDSYVGGIQLGFVVGTKF